MSDDNKNQKWFIAQCITGKEVTLKDYISSKVESEDMKEFVTEVFVPVIKYKTKTGLDREKAQFPGYIFVRFDQTSDEAWFLIRNSDGVNGIIGSSGRRTKPTPVSDAYVENLKNAKEVEKAPEAKVEINFEENETVEVISGAYAGQFGKVLNIEKTTLRVTVSIETMGRVTPVTLDIKEVKAL